MYPELRFSRTRRTRARARSSARTSAEEGCAGGAASSSGARGLDFLPERGAQEVTPSRMARLFARSVARLPARSAGEETSVPDGEPETVKEVTTNEGPKLYQSAESNHVV